MADTGHLVIDGFKAGAIKYVALEGLNTNASPPSLVACLASEGYGSGAFSNGRLLLDGFVTNPSSGGGGGSFYIFGESVIR